VTRNADPPVQEAQALARQLRGHAVEGTHQVAAVTGNGFVTHERNDVLRRLQCSVVCEQRERAAGEMPVGREHDAHVDDALLERAPHALLTFEWHEIGETQHVDALEPL
jgi:hypothetical protein